MNCPKHPKYKGIYKPQGKRKDCPTCCELYRVISEKVKSFYSLTTPNFQCGLSHVLAECAVIMLFGRQQPYFWRKNSEAPDRVKKFFGTTLVHLQAANKRNPEEFKAIKKWFGIIYIVERKKLEYDKLQYQDLKEEKTESAPKPTEKQIDEVLGLLKADKTDKNKWKMWNNLRNENGEEKR